MSHPPIRNVLRALLGAAALCPQLACSGTEPAAASATPSAGAMEVSSANGRDGAMSANGVSAAPTAPEAAGGGVPATAATEGTPAVTPIVGSGADVAPAGSGAPSNGMSTPEPTGAVDQVPATGGDADLVPLDPALLSRCTGANPITCTLNVPNGNYDVSVELGDAASAATSRVSAETRHYAGPAVQTAAGAFSRVSFTVNVREEIHDGGQRAPGNVLNLSIDGDSPKLHGLGIRPAPNAVTIFIASDSTAADWVSTNSSSLAEDETGWAQALSMYLKPGVAVANYADSGETSGSFLGRFFPPARAAMKAGDYLFIQFGHNNKQPADIARYEGDLLQYVSAARDKNAIPVIISPVSRSSGTAASPGFNDLDKVARDVAAEEDVALIDLTALSRTYYTTVPNKNALFIDGTHFHEGGAIGVAGVVAAAVESSGLGLASFVK